MSDTKWTPGKWRVISSGRHVVSDDAPGHVVIVRTGLDHSEGDEIPGTIERWEADAHLIAAAPELYEALIAAVESGMVPTSSAAQGGANKYIRQLHVADMIRAALAKARGGQ